MTLNAGYAYQERVDDKAAGTTVGDYLAKAYPRASAAEWLERIDRGEVTLEGANASAGAVLHRNQMLVWHRPPWDEPAVPRSYDVLYEDGELLAVAKPSGLPTMPGGGYLEHTLLAMVTARDPEAAPMHRLGRETSGVVLFARTHEARQKLQAAWRGHEVQKRYRTLATGTCLEDAIEITTRIGPVPHALLGTVHAATPDGKPSCSLARVLERRTERTLFEVDITTGRPHQIRIHLASIGFPLAGDPLYAPGGRPLPATHALPGDGERNPGQNPGYHGFLAYLPGR